MKMLKYGIGPFLGGLLFAIGLGISGMTEAKNIVGFLNIFGHWHAELLFVMGGAVIVNGILLRLITKRSKPLFDIKFAIPVRRDFDSRLVIGAILFGIGWGITGLCPGPGLISLLSGKPHAIVFVLTMIIGMLMAASRFGKNLFTSRKKN